VAFSVSLQLNHVRGEDDPEFGLAVNAAREGRVAASVAGAALQVYRMASAHGFGRKDTSSVYQFLKPAAKDAPV
jgi:3-hydroxyisobutyrate dehydrogenase-like beta-hydroxyacid dehydrogenase